MKIRTRVLAAAAVAVGTVAVPVAVAASSTQASAANTLCLHVYVGPSGGPGLVDLHVVVLPPLAIGQGNCPA